MVTSCCRIPAALLLSGVLAGCASAPPEPPGTTLSDTPAAWSGARPEPAPGSDSLESWWLRFDDPLLAELVAQALQANTDVAAAQAALRQARALRALSAAGLWPALGGSATAQRTRSEGRTVTHLQAGLDASWELDVFGARRDALDAAEADARAVSASLGDVQVSIAAEVALAYIGLRSDQARLAIAQDNLASQLETLQLTRWRLQAGLVTALETEQARAAAEQTRAQLPTLQTGIAQAGHALAVLSGRPPAALAAALAAAGPLPQAPAGLAIALPAETLRQRPDVRAAEHRLVAALARAAQAQAARAPDFQLGGTLGVGAATLGALTHGASVVGSLLASVSMPLFDGGAGIAQVQAQQAAAEQARAGYRATVLVALQEVEDTLVALRGERARLLSLQQAAEAAGSAARLARERYASGLVDFQTVLETQRNQLATQDAVAAAAAALSADHVRLYKALGGGWQPGEARAVDPAAGPPS